MDNLLSNNSIASLLQQMEKWMQKLMSIPLLSNKQLTLSRFYSLQ